MLTPGSLFDILSDETRLRCVLILLQRNELCVCEFCHVINCIQPKISRHLAVLRTSGIVSDERRGQWVYYRLNPDLLPWVQNIMKTTLKELKDVEPYCSDLKMTSDLGKQNLCE